MHCLEFSLFGEPYNSEFPGFCFPLLYPGQRALEDSNPELLSGTDKKKLQERLLPLAKRPGRGWPDNRNPFWQDLSYFSQTQMEKLPCPTLAVVAGLRRELIFYFPYPPCMEAGNGFSDLLSSVQWKQVVLLFLC